MSEFITSIRTRTTPCCATFSPKDRTVRTGDAGDEVPEIRPSSIFFPHFLCHSHLSSFISETEMYMSKMKTLSDSGGADGETISLVRRRTDRDFVLQNRGTGFDNLFFASGSFGRIRYTTWHGRRGREHVCIGLFFSCFLIMFWSRGNMTFFSFTSTAVPASRPRARRGSWFREAGRTERIGETTDMTHTRRAHGHGLPTQTAPPPPQYPLFDFLLSSSHLRFSSERQETPLFAASSCS